jgi:NADPH:quinone reductase-like Zn-dependent oxidoreductase
MHRVVIHKPGGHSRLRIEEHPDPTPGPGEVLLDVAAAGVNFADCVVRMGLYQSARDYVGWPITPGFEVAGTVAACGDGVDDLEVGDSVVAITLFGGYASRLVVPRHQVFKTAGGLSLTATAGFPTVFLTAYYALFELAHVRAGRRILVHSAGGGVGGALVQLAKNAGCEVVGVVGGGHKVDAVLGYGADSVIDTSREDLISAARRLSPDGYDVVLDANGGPSLKQSYRLLRSPGTLVVYGFHTMFRRGRGRPDWPRLVLQWLRTPRFNPLDMTNSNRSVVAFNLSYLFEEKEILAEAMSRLLDLLEQGRICPLATAEYRFEAVAEAHRALESGETVGKLVLVMES